MNTRLTVTQRLVLNILADAGEKGTMLSRAESTAAMWMRKRIPPLVQRHGFPGGRVVWRLTPEGWREVRA